MAMGKRTSEQAPMWIPTTDLPVSPGHPFYARLNIIRGRVRSIHGRPVSAVLRAGDGTAQPAAGTVLPVAAARLLRGARLGAGHRLARGRFARRAQLRRAEPQHRGPGSFDDLAHAALDPRRDPSGDLHV